MKLPSRGMHANSCTMQAFWSFFDPGIFNAEYNDSLGNETLCCVDVYFHNIQHPSVALYHLRPSRRSYERFFRSAAIGRNIYIYIYTLRITWPATSGLRKFIPSRSLFTRTILVHPSRLSWRAVPWRKSLARAQRSANWPAPSK